MISDESETKSYEILQYAEILEHQMQGFNAIVNGTNDPSAGTVYSAFLTARKELYKAAKETLLAAQAGYDWSGDSPKELVLKKVMR